MHNPRDSKIHGRFTNTRLFLVFEFITSRNSIVNLPFTEVSVSFSHRFLVFPSSPGSYGSSTLSPVVFYAHFSDSPFGHELTDFVRFFSQALLFLALIVWQVHALISVSIGFTEGGTLSYFPSHCSRISAHCMWPSRTYIITTLRYLPSWSILNLQFFYSSSAYRGCSQPIL